MLIEILVYTACTKLKTPTEGVRLVLEKDGADIDRKAVLTELCAANGYILMLLRKKEQWSPRVEKENVERRETG